MRPPGFKIRWASPTACCGMLGVMQRLAEERQIDGAGADGNLFDIAFAVFEIVDAVFAGQFGAVLHHLFRVVDGDYFLGAARQQLGESAFAGA